MMSSEFRHPLIEIILPAKLVRPCHSPILHPLSLPDRIALQREHDPAFSSSETKTPNSNNLASYNIQRNDFFDSILCGTLSNRDSLSSTPKSSAWRKLEEQQDIISATKTCRPPLAGPRARPRPTTRRRLMPFASRRARLRIYWTPGRIRSSRIFPPSGGFLLL